MTPGGTRKPEFLAVYPKEHPPLPVVLQTWSPNQQSGTTWEPDRKANISGPTPDVLEQKFRSGTQLGRRPSTGCQCTLESEKYFLCKQVSRASSYLGRCVPASVLWMFPTFPTKGRASRAATTLYHGSRACDLDRSPQPSHMHLPFHSLFWEDL